MDTLSNLSQADENKFEIAKSGGFPPLITLTQHGDMIVGSMAAAALANLAEVKELQGMLTREGAVRPCVSAMRSRFVEVQREAGRLLANLCSSESDLTKLIIQYGGHQLLIGYLMSQDTACQRAGALGIGNLCTKDIHRVSLEDVLVVRKTVILEGDSFAEWRRMNYSFRWPFRT